MNLYGVVRHFGEAAVKHRFIVAERIAFSEALPKGLSAKWTGGR
jgi:hypothetical protein